MADTTIDLLKNSSYVGKMDELIAAVKLGSGATSDVEWDNVKNKPTTIGGYGIIDAKIDNGTITLGNQTITPLTSAPVTSVNSKTGVVTLSAADVSAIPSTLTGTAGQVLTKTADGQEWKDVDIPTALPNPNALTFTGAVTGSYDGSAPLTVEIPIGGGGEWETVIDTTFTESAMLNTGEMPGKTEMLCVFAVPKSDSNVTLSATSAACGKSLSGFAMGSASYGKIGVIYAKKICGHAIAYAGSGDTTSTNPGLDTSPRTNLNLQYYRITTNVTDIPLKLTSALPAGTIIKVFVR